jgi:hypothetical protein
MAIKVVAVGFDMYPALDGVYDPLIQSEVFFILIIFHQLGSEIGRYNFANNSNSQEHRF